MKKIIIVALTIILLLLNQQNLSAADSRAQAVLNAINYLHSVQNDDGGFPFAKNDPSNQAVTCWVVIALESLNQDVKESNWAPAGVNPVDYLTSNPMQLNGTCDYARTLLALTAAEESTYKEKLIQNILSFQQEDGQFTMNPDAEKGFINSHIWSIIALHSAGQEIPNQHKAREWLINRQNSDGGFGWCEGTSSDADDTAAALKSLVILGEDPNGSDSIKSALKYLKSCQSSDGGFNSGYLAGEEANAISDAWAIQALLYCGEDPTAEAWSINNHNAVEHLMSLQNDKGFFNWRSDLESSPVYTTATAINALAMLPPQEPLSGSVDKYSWPDLSETHWAYQAIVDLAQAGGLAGYPDGTIKPDQAVTRAEFSRMLVTGLNLEEQEKDGKHFVDVIPGFWAESYIEICAENGYMQGRPGNIFDPHSKISGAEMAVILFRGLAPETLEVEAGGIWYEPYVRIGIEKNWLYPNFLAETPASRAECAYSIMKIRSLQAGNGKDC